MFFCRRLIISFFFILFSCDNNDTFSIDTYSDVLLSKQFNPKVLVFDDIDFSSTTNYVNPPHLYSGNFSVNGFYESSASFDYNLISIINWSSIPVDICNYALSDTMSLNSVKFYYRYNSDDDQPAFSIDAGITTQINYENSVYNDLAAASIDKSVSSYNFDYVDKTFILTFDSSVFGEDFNICNYENFIDCSVQDPTVCEGDLEWEEGLGNGMWDEGETMNSTIEDNINIIIKNSGSVEIDLYANEISFYSGLNHLVPYIQYNFTNLNTNEADSLIRKGDHKDKYLSDYSESILPLIGDDSDQYLINYFGNISASLSFSSADFIDFQNHVIADNEFTYLDVNLTGPGMQYDSVLDSMQIDIYLTTNATEYITRIANQIYPEDNFIQEPHNTSNPSIRIPAYYIKNVFQNLLNESINEVTFYIKPSGRFNNFQTLYFGEPSLQLVMHK